MTKNQKYETPKPEVPTEKVRNDRKQKPDLVIPNPSTADFVRSDILRCDAALTRDCWFTSDDDYLVIRQVTYDEDGSNPRIKQILLSPEEWRAMYVIIKLHMGIK